MLESLHEAELLLSAGKSIDLRFSQKQSDIEATVCFLLVKISFTHEDSLLKK